MCVVLAEGVERGILECISVRVFEAKLVQESIAYDEQEITQGTYPQNY